MRRFLLGAALLFAALAQADPIVLRLSTWEGDEGLKIQRQAVQEFEAAHPNVRVKLENNDFGAYFQKLLVQFASGTAPDVSMMTFEHFQSFGKRNVLLPLDPFIAQTPGFDVKDYYPEMIRAHQYQGRLYVLPRDIAPHGLIFYNRKLFREAGLAYPKTSWTWDFKVRPELKENDFLYVLQKLTKFDAEGKPIQWGFSPADPVWLAQTFGFSQGARVVDNDEEPTKVLYNSPEMIRSYEFVNELAFDRKWIPTQSELDSVLQSSAREMFERGKIAMIQVGVWEVPNIRRALIPGKPGFFDWDVTIFPAYKNGGRAFTTGGSGYSIVAQTKHPKEAWELVRWLGGPPGIRGLAESGIAQPAIRKMALSEPWVPGPNTPEVMRWPPSRIVTDEAVKYVIFPPTSEYWNDLNGFIQPRIASIWSREQTPKQALDLGVSEAQVRLDQLNKIEHLPAFNWQLGLGLGVCLLLALGGWIWIPTLGKAKSMRQRESNRAAYKFIAPWLIGLLVFTAGPMILSLLMSFADWDMILPARSRGLGNFVEAFTTDPRFWVSIKVTCVYTFLSVPLGVASSLLIAVLLNQQVKGMRIFRTCFYIPTVGSAVASALIWKRLFQPQSGLINTIIYGADGHHNFLGLATLLQPWAPPGQSQVDWLGSERTALAGLIIMSLWGFGSVLILLAGLQGVPQHYYEAATLDGARAVQRFRHVTLPLVSPAIFFSLVTGFIGSFQTFTQTFVLTQGGPGDATRFYMLNLYNQAFNSLRMGYASALAWILFFIILGFTLIQFRASKWVYSEAG